MKEENIQTKILAKLVSVHVFAEVYIIGYHMQEVNRCVVYISLSHRSHSPETSQKKTNKSTSFEVTQATYNLLFIVSYALVGHVKTQKSIFEYL